MAIVDVQEMSKNPIELPQSVSYVQLNEDGTYEDASSEMVDIFIDEDQVHKISNSETSAYIRQYFGRVVGIIHHHSPRVTVSGGAPRMFVLGN